MRATLRALFVTFVLVIGVVLGLEACGADRPLAADGNANAFGGVVTGRCNVDGETTSCHYETGRVDGIVNCFIGKQTCVSGAWGPCVGDGTIASMDLGQLALGRKSSALFPETVTATVPSADAGACLQNPCNPYCVGIDVDADSLMPDGGFTQFAILGTVKTPDQFPGGITGPKNAMGTFATTGPPAYVQCTQAHPPTDGKSCSSDYCCASVPMGTATNTCQPWVTVGGTNPVADAKCVKAAGVDFELGLACNDSNGHVHVPICNRGTADATSGNVMIAEYPGNPKYAGDLSGPSPGNFCNNPGDPSAYCLLDLGTKRLDAGKCIDVDLTAGVAAGTAAGVTCPASGFSSGNRTMLVNPPAPPLGWATSFNPPYATVTEADYCNNYSFHPTTAQGGTCSAYGAQPPAPSALSFTYKASCPPGYRAVWNQFSYDTLVPSESQIQFFVASAQSLADGGTGAFTADVQAANIKSSSSPDPASCAMSGAPDASVCPKDLATLLGSPAKYNDTLEITVNEIAISALPIVLGWKVTFSCVPYE